MNEKAAITIIKTILVFVTLMIMFSYMYFAYENYLIASMIKSGVPPVKAVYALDSDYNDLPLILLSEKQKGGDLTRNE